MVSGSGSVLKEGEHLPFRAKRKMSRQPSEAEAVVACEEALAWW